MFSDLVQQQSLKNHILKWFCVTTTCYPKNSGNFQTMLLMKSILYFQKPKFVTRVHFSRCTLALKVHFLLKRVFYTKKFSNTRSFKRPANIFIQTAKNFHFRFCTSCLKIDLLNMKLSCKETEENSIFNSWRRCAYEVNSSFEHCYEEMSEGALLAQQNWHFSPRAGRWTEFNSNLKTV